MKKLLKLFICLLLSCHLLAQDEAEKPELLVSLRYFSTNGSFQYLKVKTMTKEDGKLLPVKDAAVQLYLDVASAGNLISKIKTDANGESKAIIPVSLKEKWLLSSSHKFIAVSEAGKKFEETVTELQIARAKIAIDTLNVDGTRQVNVQVLSFDSSGWVPAKDVEVKIGVRRLIGDLKIGEEDTYTTDSMGLALAEFRLDKLPASDKNNLVLVAKMEDNDLFGNIAFEKTVPWGQYKVAEINFGERSLWGTRDKAPLWLLLVALSIMVGVWSVIVYLLIQIRRLRKLKKETLNESRSKMEVLQRL